ncbi:MAG: LysM peptidoglycan-binding domain-containing protein [Synechococcus sp.]|nr:LysM peptidoglycan-binding domain-containing protein [Synechococcus sp.]
MRRTLVALVLALALPLPLMAGQVTVRPGETLSEIAERHGISLTRLMAINGIRDADLVQTGQVLTVPGSGGSRGGGAAGTITVQPGETLSEIAERHGISLTRLMAINGIRDADLVQTGQVLSVPGSGGSRGGGAAGTITVQPGETLSELAERHGIGINQLMQLNGLRDPDAVEAGQSLRISTARPAAAGRPSPPRYPRGASSHVVRDGENLSLIASGYGISLSQLIAINAIGDPNRVEVGTRLRLRGQPPARGNSGAGRPAPAAGGQVRANPPLAAAPRPAASQAAGRGRTAPAAATTAAATTTATGTAPTPATGTAPAGTAPAAAAAPATATTTTASPAASSPTTNPAVAAAGRSTPSPAAASPRPGGAGTPASGGPGANTSSTASSTASTSPARGGATPAGASSPRPPASTTLARADWRTYGPLQVNWAAWQAMGGSMVAPGLNAKGQPLYLAINCNARKINATTASGQWQAWEDPNTDYEQQLLRDYCRSGA